MKQISTWRISLMIAVTLLSIYLTFPTARYLLTLHAEPPAESEEHKAWEERSEKLRTEAIPLGLDLRGGVDVTLKIDQAKSRSGAVKAMVTRLNNSFTDRKVSAKATETPDNQALIIRVEEKTDARQVFNELTNYKTEFVAVPTEADLADKGEVRVEIDPRTLERKAGEDIKGAEKMVRDRLDKLGLSQPSIAIQGNNQIRVQIAGEKDPDKVIGNLTRLAHMEFRLTHPRFRQQDDPIHTLLDDKGNLRPDAAIPLGYEVLDYKFGRLKKETQKIEYETGKMLVEQEVKFTGKNLRSAGVIQDQMDLENMIKVSLQFDAQAADIFARMTRQSVEEKNKGGTARNLAIILDDVVMSAPTMQVVIAGGSAVIEGGFTFDEAQDLSNILKAGSLPAPLIVESKQAVGATLGTESIFAGVRALAWGTLVVVVFMIAYYGTAGVISVVALLLNVLIILGILSLAKATLTLSGIGGILLTVGMAVDANVLIYERMREEVQAGRPLKQAIRLGFDRAFAVILDSNLTTLLSALVLLQFTSGPVFGFALTMAFGLIANLYTGLTVTQTLCSLWFEWRGSLSLGRLRLLTKTSIDFIRLRFLSFGGSALALLVGLAIVMGEHRGLEFGVDFTGGLLAQVRFVEPAGETAVREALAKGGLASGERVQRIQDVAGQTAYLIRVKTMKPADTAAADQGDLAVTEATLRASLVSAFGEGKFAVEQVISFGSETGQNFRNMAISVILLASVAILIYLWFRFELVFGVAAVIALIHDLLLTTLWATAWNVEITLDVVAALLVLLGFSVNDTIVIFDRVRENVQKGIGKTFRETCNLAMNQSLSRTLITNGTVLAVVAVMLVVGGEGLAPFAKILFIGAFIGTYSTDFIATPIVYMWNQRKRGTPGGPGAIVEALKPKTLGPELAKAPKPTAPKAPTVGAGVPSRRGV